MTALRDGELETAVEMAGAVRAGTVSSVELIERSLARLERWQPYANTCSQLWAEQALEAARTADRASPRALDPLAGVPVVVKDLFDVAGHVSTGCCAAYRGRPPATADAPVVAAWRRAGAVVVGKANQHELAAGGTNLVSACGRTGNPWDPARMTGGSSGGSAAAVASGGVPMALGSDTGGSIRIPASMCGCFGLKPTHGRFSLRGVMPLAPSMDCPGPLAATASDLVLAYLGMGGTPGDDGGSFRIGVPHGGFFEERVHEEARETVVRAMEGLREAGCAVGEVDGRGLDGVRGLWLEVCAPEFWEAHPALRAERLEGVAAQPRAWLDRGSRATPAERADAERRRAAVRSWFAGRLETFDALLVPTTPYPAPRADQETVDLGGSGTVAVDEVGPGYLTCSVNLAGLPAVNLPAGRSADGMPIGVSLVGRDMAEWDLLAMARRWEEATGYRPDRPPLPA